MRVSLSLAALILAPTLSLAQANALYDDFVSPERYTVADRDLGLHIDANFFFKNNEYFSPYAEGYTLIGYQLRPTVSWRIHSTLTLTGGLQAMMYGGLERAHYVRPHFAALWQATDWLSIQMGSLPGATSHPAHEAMQDPEQQLTDQPELGLQLYITSPKLHGSLWLNWRQFIFMGDTIPERFTAGASMLLSPTPDKDGLSFQLPFALIFNHIGGQISNYPDKMQSLANLSLSPTLSLTPSSSHFVHSLSLSLHLLYLHTMAGSEVRPFANGRAISPHLSLTARHLQASLAYFHSTDFYAPHGNPLFSSLSNYDPAVYSPHRNLLTLNASFVNAIGRIARFSLDAKAYIDTNDARLDYSYGLNLVLTPGLSRRHAPIPPSYRH